MTRPVETENWNMSPDDIVLQQCGKMENIPPNLGVIPADPSPKRPKRNPCALDEPESVKKLLALIRDGNYLTTACDLVRVDRHTVTRWALDGSDPDCSDPEKAKFAEELAEAIATAEARHVRIISKAAENDARLSMEFLARRFPEKWGKREKVEMTGGTDNTVTVKLQWPGKGSDPDSIIDVPAIGQ